MGEHFGNVEIISNTCHENTVVAIEDSLLWFLTEEDYLEIFRDVKEIQVHKLLSALVNNLNGTKLRKTSV